MNSKRSLILLALPLALAACGGDDADTAETPADSAIAAINAPSADPNDMAGMASTLALQPMGGSRATGQATVTPNGQQTQVQVQLSGLTPGATYHFRVVASNPDGTATGADQTFSALAAAPTFDPSHPPAPTTITKTTAAVRATVNPGGNESGPR